jgi:hypothetical protein
MQFLEAHSLLPLTALRFLNSRLKGDSVFIFIFELSRCVSENQSQELTLKPLHLCISRFFGIFTVGSLNMFLVRHLNEFLSVNRMI